MAASILFSFRLPVCNARPICGLPCKNQGSSCFRYFSVCAFLCNVIITSNFLRICPKVAGAARLQLVYGFLHSLRSLYPFEACESDVSIDSYGQNVLAEEKFT